MQQCTLVWDGLLWSFTMRLLRAALIASARSAHQRMYARCKLTRITPSPRTKSISILLRSTWGMSYRRVRFALTRGAWGVPSSAMSTWWIASSTFDSTTFMCAS